VLGAVEAFKANLVNSFAVIGLILLMESMGVSHSWIKRKIRIKILTIITIIIIPIIIITVIVITVIIVIAIVIIVRVAVM
jgi:hypothetical protein